MKPRNRRARRHAHFASLARMAGALRKCSRSPCTLTLAVALVLPAGCSDARESQSHAEDLRRRATRAVRELYEFEGVPSAAPPAIRLVSASELSANIASNVSRRRIQRLDHAAHSAFVDAMNRGVSTYYARYDASHHELLLDPHAVQEIVQQVDASVREDALDILMWHEAGHVLAEDLFSCTQTLATLQDLEAQRVYLAMMEGYAQAAARRMARARSTEVTMNSLIDKVWSGLDYWDEAPERSLSEPYDHTLRADTTSMYVDGERLVESLMRAGGEQLVAAAFSAPPGQLEVLSDPELYASLARHANAGDDSVIGEFLRESAREAQRIATELEGSALPGVTLKSATLSAIAYELRFQDYRLGLPASILTDACRALVIDDHSNGFQSTQVLLGGVTFETREGAARAFARLSELNSSYAIRGRDHYRELTGFSLGESVGRDLDCSNSYRSSLRVPDQSASETLRDLMRERFYYSACLFESTIVEGVFAHEVGASLDRDGILREMLTQIKR